LFEQGVDSLDFFSLIFDVESKYKIKINQKLYLKLNTIKKFAKNLKNRDDYNKENQIYLKKIIKIRRLRKN